MPGDRDDEVRGADPALFCGQAGTPPLYTDEQLEEIRANGELIAEIRQQPGWKVAGKFGDAEREMLQEVLRQHTPFPALLASPSLLISQGTPDASRLASWFSYHAPVADQAERYEALRAAGRRFAALIVELTPPGPDQDEAVKLVRSTVHWANAAIACSPVESLPPTPAQRYDRSCNQKPPEPVDE